MKNIDIKNLQAAAARKGVTISEFHCQAFLAAKALLAQDPTNETAKTIIRHFLDRLAGKNIGATFEEYTLPWEVTETDEEREVRIAAREEFLANQHRMLEPHTREA